MINVALISPNKNAYSETFIHHHKISINGNIKYLYQGTLPEMSEDEGVIVSYGFFNKVRRKLNTLLKIGGLNFHERALCKYFIRHNIQICLAEFGMTGADMVNVCRKCNIPLLVHFHGLDAYVDNILFSYTEKYQRLFAYAEKVFVVSNHMHNQLLKLGCPREKLVINTYGPSDTFFKINNLHVGKDFIAVGRFVEKKAPHLSIRAFAEVLKHHPDATLTMVGDGPLHSQCKQLVEELEIADRVKFLGVADRTRIQELFSKSIAFIQHSITAKNGDMEGTPVAIIEASASGLPVVATSHAGIPDVIVDGTTGFLVAELDQEGMTMGMKKILDSPGLSVKFGSAGRERIRQKFTLDKHIATLDDCIRQFAKNSK